MDRPLSLVQLVSIEFHPFCNLSAEHTACPGAHADRYDGLAHGPMLDDDLIVDTAVRMVRDYGFGGVFGWHNYNEPLAQTERMFGLMDRIDAQAPTAKYLLWTNGTLLPEDVTRFGRFAIVHITDYGGARTPKPEIVQALTHVCPNVKVQPGRFDMRRHWPTTQMGGACRKPLFELLIDVYGNLTMCCFDWRGQMSPGNLRRDGLEACVAAWERQMQKIVAWPMSEQAPAQCQICPFRASRLPRFDIKARQRAKRWLGLTADAEVAHG